MFGFMSRREVRSTACSRNSLANWVWAVREEWPSKAEESSSAVEEGLLEREREGLLLASFKGLLAELPTRPRPPVVAVGVAEGGEARVDGWLWWRSVADDPPATADEGGGGYS